MIPKVIHRVWLGPAKIPPAYREFWSSFKALHPDWELATWTDSDLDWLTNRGVYDTVTTFSERSDVVRFELLAKHGGIYVDADVEPLRPFDDLRSSGAFAGWEQPGRLCGAVLGSEAGHPAALALVEHLPNWARKHARRTAETRTGPVYLTQQWKGRPDVTLYHRDAFFPVHWSERERLGGSYPATSYSVHHWAHSWAAK